MKKKHFKLLTTMASLLLVVSVMAVGIWAATQQTFKLTSSISFAATGIEASIFAKVEGDVGTATIGGESVLGSTYKNIYEFTAGTTATEAEEALVLAFDDTNKDGYIVRATSFDDAEEGTNKGVGGEAIKLSLVIVNISSATDLVYYVESFIATISPESQIDILSVKSGTYTVGYDGEQKTITGADAIEVTTVNISEDKYVFGSKASQETAAKLAKGTTDAYNALKIEIVLTVVSVDDDDNKMTALSGDSGFNIDAAFANSYEKLLEEMPTTESNEG